MLLSESELLRRARQFDERALGEIYDRLSPALYRYAYRLLGEVSLAEEVVADAFHRYLLALRNGGGPTEHLSAYLYRVAHNLITDRFRRPPPLELALDESLVAADSDPGENVDSAQAQARARAALWLLTPEQRQVIVLKYFEGLSNEEAAAALDRPVSAVKSLQHRALASLQRLLGEETRELLR